MIHGGKESRERMWHWNSKLELSAVSDLESKSEEKQWSSDPNHTNYSNATRISFYIAVSVCIYPQVSQTK